MLAVEIGFLAVGLGLEVLAFSLIPKNDGDPSSRTIFVGVGLAIVFSTRLAFEAKTPDVFGLLGVVMVLLSLIWSPLGRAIDAARRKSPA